MLTEQDIEKADIIAKHMYEKYKMFQYTASERASDHAFLYPSDSWGRAFWLAVNDALMVLHDEAKKKRKADT